MNKFFENLLSTIAGTATSNWTKILTFVLVLVLGYVLIRIIGRIVVRAMDRSKLRGATGNFLASLIRVAMLAIYVVILLSMLGVDTTSLVAVFSVLTLAISLAVQGVVSNLASGITLVVTKPFEEGDYVEIDGTGGTVESISIFSTKLRTGDNKVIIIPNGNITSANIVNYSTKGTRRLDLAVSAAYGTEIAKVKQTVLEVVSRHEEIFEDPAPVVRLKEQGDSALIFTVRVWLKSSDYWNMHFDLNEELYEAFQEKGIDIPFPQLDVRVKQ